MGNSRYIPQIQVLLRLLRLRNCPKASTCISEPLPISLSPSLTPPCPDPRHPLLRAFRLPSRQRHFRRGKYPASTHGIVTLTLHFAEKFTFFDFFRRNIWSCQKKVVILQTFSSEPCLSARVCIRKSMEYFSKN